MSDEESIFAEALGKRSAAERAAYLDEACAGDGQLRRDVDALLAAHLVRADILDAPLAGFDVKGQAPAAPHGVGSTVGPYKLLERIGGGGMGVVYMAEQLRPVRRIVALKIIKPGMDSGQVIARFEAERQALTMMDHPNIAKVLDAGTTDAGRPYFAMELVKGIPITDYCDQARLTPRQRLELFVQVCQAVQHAHQKGVIHRDLKPGNILVTLHDGRPVPKVIDFGVAKATAGRLTDLTLFTNFSQMVGTPLYMSPEQAQISGLDVDTRSDVYSLGVLLYELLTGTTPFDRQRLREAAHDEMRRIIREEDPPAPSTRLGTVGAQIRIISAHRHTDPKKLGQLVCGELDWIVMKALEKDRARRYETAIGLGRDVERYLRDEAVQACPPSAAYRLRKGIRRHKGPVIAGLIVALALAGGIVGTTAGLIRARVAQSRATDLAAQKQEALAAKGAALAAAQRSERARAEQLWEALVAQARANRFTGRPGQRFQTLDILKRATQLARTLNLPEEKRDQLRDAAIATLALPDLALGGPLHPWPAGARAFDFDESHLIYARADQEGNCTICRATDDFELHRLPGLGMPATPTFTPDGKFLAVLHGNQPDPRRAVHLWQLGPSSAQRLLAEESVASIGFRGSTLLAVGYHDGAVGVFELPSARELGRLPAEMLTREIGVALHPSEPVVAVWSYFSTLVQLRDRGSGSVIASAVLPNGATGVTWHPDGNKLAVGSGDTREIWLYDRDKLQKPYLTLNVSQYGSVPSFNPAGDRLVTGGWGSILELFDAATGRRLWTTAPCLYGRRFDPSGTRLAGCVEDDKLGIWQVADAREYRALSYSAYSDDSDYFDAAVSPDGRLLAAAVTNGVVIWDLASGSALAFVPVTGQDHRLVFDSSGSLLTLTSGDSGVVRWPVSSDAGVPGNVSVGDSESLPLPPGSALSVSRDAKVIVVCCRAVSVQQRYAGGWILHGDRPSAPIRIAVGSDVVHIAVSPDSKWVVTVAMDTGATKVWDAGDGRFVKELPGPGSAVPCFSPDGKWLRVGNDGGRLVAVGKWEFERRVPQAAVFAPDSRLMAAATARGIQLIDATAGRTLATLDDSSPDPATHVLFSPDGTKLIALARNKGLRVWDLRLIRERLKEMGLDWEWPRPAAGE